jgi:hypothetical protein
MNILPSGRFALIPDLNLRFGYFGADSLTVEPDLVIEIGPFVPDKPDCVLVDHTYSIGPGYVYCRDRKGSANWEFELSGLETSRTTLRFHGSMKGLQDLLYPDLLAQNLIGRSLLQFKLRQKGWLMLHAAAVSRNGKAIILAGRGGAGKSTLAMKLLRTGQYSYLGDDWIALKDGVVYPMPTHFREFNYKMAALDDEHVRGLLQRIRYVWNMMGNTNYTSLPYQPGQPAEVDKIFLIDSVDTDSLETMPLDPSSATERLLANNRMEEMISSMGFGKVLNGFERYFLAYSFVYPHNALTRYWHDVKSDLAMLTERYPVHHIIMPRHATARQINEVFRLFKEQPL